MSDDGTKDHYRPIQIQKIIPLEFLILSFDCFVFKTCGEIE